MLSSPLLKCFVCSHIYLNYSLCCCIFDQVHGVSYCFLLYLLPVGKITSHNHSDNFLFIYFTLLMVKQIEFKPHKYIIVLDNCHL